MNMRKFMALTILLCLLFTSALAQKKEVTGKVVDSTTQEPIRGVSVLSDKKGNAVATDAAGNFRIQVESNATMLIFSSVGYITQTIPINQINETAIRLSRSAAALDEV